MSTQDLSLENPCHVHFIGIGGISMSGLAEILLERGFTISGSDNTPSPVTEKLSQAGALINYPQSADNITDDIDMVVYTAAIHPDNPEYAACVEAKLPMMTRARLLGRIMEYYPASVTVAGTHGKTTTTAMTGQILMEEGADPTISIGGMFSAIGGNIRVGTSDVFLAEACEYTNSFHEFYPKYNVILNIEEDHMDFFKDLDDVRSGFRRFAKNTSSDGVLVISSEIDNWQDITEGLLCRIITVGINSESDYYPTDIEICDDGATSFVPLEKGKALSKVRLFVPGIHNVKNALAAIAITRAMGVGEDSIVKALEAFRGADRRFQYKGTFKGAKIYDDYAHHPTEIRAAISAARQLPHKRLVVVFQPHTYTRTKAFLDDFADELSRADVVMLCPVYAAREEDIYGVHSDDIKRLIDDKIAAKTPECKASECYCFADFKETENFIQNFSSTGDLLITMGAGNVVMVGEDILAD